MITIEEFNQWLQAKTDGVIRREEREMFEDGQLPLDPKVAKDTNPKSTVASDKLPLHLWPAPATMMGCLGCLDGMLKYGRSNYRVSGVSYVTYLDAIARHSMKLLENQDLDDDSGLHHLCHILASAAILAEALAQGNLNDDRNVNGGKVIEFMRELTGEVARLKRLHTGKDPKHYSIKDNK